MKENREIKLSDFSINAVLSAYKLIRDFLFNEDVSDDEALSKMTIELDSYKICIPEVLFKKYVRL